MAEIEFSDTWWDCQATDNAGNWGRGVITVTTEVLGDIDFVCILTDTVITATVTLLGDENPGVLNTDTVITVTVGIQGVDVLTELYKENFVIWGQPGTMNFTRTKGGNVGKRPMDWKGWAWGLLKLGKHVVCYGENGVTMLTGPMGPEHRHAYAMNTLYRIGLLGKHAYCGTDTVHHFVDNKGQMFRLTEEGLALLDYSEYLSNMTRPVMSLDTETGLISICDGQYGFVYSTEDNSLGEGPANITGIYSQGGTKYVVSSGSIVTDPLGVWTDIIDFGDRTGRSIYSLEIGTDLTETLYAALEYRQNKASAFSRTAWYTVNQHGEVWIPLFAVDFRVGVRLDTYQYHEIDYINIHHE